MTLVGLEFLKHQETQRHNLATEDLTLRSQDNERLIARERNQSTERIASLDRQSKEAIASLDRQSRENIALLDRSSRENIAALDRESRAVIAEADRSSRESIADKDRQSREDIAAKDRTMKWVTNPLTAILGVGGRIAPALILGASASKDNDDGDDSDSQGSGDTSANLKPKTQKGDKNPANNLGKPKFEGETTTEPILNPLPNNTQLGPSTISKGTQILVGAAGGAALAWGVTKLMDRYKKNVQNTLGGYV